MARSARRLIGSRAIELKHPLRLWQRDIQSSASVEQARLLLVDIAAERARAGEADLTVDAEQRPRASDDLRQSVEQWRHVAAGVAIGDGAALIALARGLALERDNQRLGEVSLDAGLTALALASRSGSAPERTVACLELLLALPEIIGKSTTIARRARALAALFRVFQSLRWAASGRTGRDQPPSMSAMMEALATVETSAVRRGFFVGNLDRKALFGRFVDLSAAEPLTSGGDANEDDEATEGCETDLLPSSRRLGLTGSGIGIDPAAGALERPFSIVPFAKFNPDRLSDSRKTLGDRYAALAKPLTLTSVPSRRSLDVALDALAREMPNFGPVIERINDELALARCTASRVALRLPPLLLVGPPGIGKTRFAARLAACLGLPWACLALAGSSDNRELAGTARGWSTAHASWPVEQLVQLETANPLLVIDEVDKAGGNERNGQPLMSLLTLLERRTSQLFFDECLGGPIDLSMVSWLLTANSTSGLPGPLVSRLIVVSVQAPAADQVGVMLATMQQEIAAERGATDSRMLPTLPKLAMDRLREGYAAHGDPRRLRAELSRILGIAARAEEVWATTSVARLH